MFITSRCVVPAFLGLSSALLAAAPAWAASWQNGVNYGGSGAVMDLYVPDAVDASPAILVALHYCSGNAGSTHAWFQSMADQYGFIIVSPGVGAGKNCWNATPARSGELASIVQMVTYTIAQKGADSTQVFVAGASSGACMTNALLAAYPDVFAAGSLLAGVPAGAWMGGNECSVCSQNPPNRTAQQWGDLVRNAYAFNGTRPRVQLFHGTSDTTLNYSNLAAEVAQWTNVFGLTDANASMESNKPKSGWNRTSYTSGSRVVLEVNIGQGQSHDLAGQGLFTDIVRFFGLNLDSAGAGGAGGAGGSGSGGAAAAGSGGASGAVNAGGAGAGGSDSNGGVANSAGTANGGSNAGSSVSGGSSAGGATSAGGNATTAGTSSTGGVSGTSSTGSAPTSGGGTSAGGTSAGGTTTTAGSATGGNTSFAGTSSGRAGASAGGSTNGRAGSPTTGLDGDVPSDDGGGCSVAARGDRSLAACLGLLAAAIGVILRRRRTAEPRA